MVIRTEEAITETEAGRMGVILPVVRPGEDGVHLSLFKLPNSSAFKILSN